jgi:hypothetical protein
MSEATAQSASNAASAGALELSCFQQFIVAYDTIDGKGLTWPIVDEIRASSSWGKLHAFPQACAAPYAKGARLDEREQLAGEHHSLRHIHRSHLGLKERSECEEEDTAMIARISGTSRDSRASGSATITSDPVANRTAKQGGALKVTAGSTPEEDID